MNIEHLAESIEKNFEELTPGSLTGDTVLADLIIWNSFNALVVHVVVKEEFGVEVPWAAFRKMKTIQDLYNYIQEAKAE